MDDKKTVQTPVEPEVLQMFGQLSAHKAQLCEQYVDLENEKIRLQIAIRGLDQEKQRLFEKVLLDRGLSATTPVEIDPDTGLIELVTAKTAPAPQ